MAEIKKEEAVESTVKQEQPKIDEKVDKLKIKAKPKMKKFSNEDDIIKYPGADTQQLPIYSSDKPFEYISAVSRRFISESKA